MYCGRREKAREKNAICKFIHKIMQYLGIREEQNI